MTVIFIPSFVKGGLRRIFKILCPCRLDQRDNSTGIVLRYKSRVAILLG
jgi:hypothetical protein